jgi:hypothetical protein
MDNRWEHCTQCLQGGLCSAVSSNCQWKWDWNLQEVFTGSMHNVGKRTETVQVSLTSKMSFLKALNKSQISCMLTGQPTDILNMNMSCTEELILWNRSITVSSTVFSSAISAATSMNTHSWCLGPALFITANICSNNIASISLFVMYKEFESQ